MLMAAVAESSEQPRRSKIGEARKRNVEESRTRCRQEREEKDKDKQDGGAWDQHAPRFLAHLSQARLRIYGQWELCISRRPHVKRPKKGTGLSGLALVSCCSPGNEVREGRSSAVLLLLGRLDKGSVVGRLRPCLWRPLLGVLAYE